MKCRRSATAYHAVYCEIKIGNPWGNPGDPRRLGVQSVEEMLGAPAMRRSYPPAEASQLRISAGFDRAVRHTYVFRTCLHQSYAVTRTLDNRPFFRAIYSIWAVFGLIGVQLP